MDEIKQAIDKVYKTGKLPKDFSLEDFRILELIYRELKQHHKSEFIQENIKAFLDKCGIKTKAKGIGWEAFI